MRAPSASSVSVLFVLALAASSCRRAPAPPSGEFKAAMQLYEDTVSETLDPNYRHPDFQKVAAALERVPTTNEREYRTAQGILENIRAAQNEVRAQEASLRSARESAEAAAAAAAAADQGVQGSGDWSSSSSPRSAVPYERGSSGEPRTGFDRAAERARMQNAVRAQQESIQRDNQREAEIRAKMQRRLDEKMEERMNAPLDEGHWKVEETKDGPRLKTTVEVKREEVE